MTQKKAAQGEKIIRMFRELKDMDLDGIPLITFDEYEKAKSKKDGWTIAQRIVVGALGMLMILGLLKDIFHIQF